MDFETGLVFPNEPYVRLSEEEIDLPILTCLFSRTEMFAYFYETKTHYREFEQKYSSKQKRDENLTIEELITSSAFQLYELPSRYLRGIDYSYLSIPLPREARFWLLHSGEMPPEITEYLKYYPWYLYPAYKHFPEQVEKWMNDSEYRHSKWPYDTKELPEKIAYDTLHPDAVSIPKNIDYEWLDEFPDRDFWIRLNIKYF